MEDALHSEARVNAAIAELAEALITSPSIETIAALVLRRAQELTESPHGYVGHIDPETDQFTAAVWTEAVSEECRVAEADGLHLSRRGLAAWVLENRRPLLTNEAAKDPRSCGVPEGHVPIERFLSVPAIVDGTLIGQICVANSPRDYVDADRRALERFASLFALAVQSRQREDALTESEERFRAVFDSAAAGILIIDANGRLIRTNAAFERMLGYTKAELHGQPLPERSHPDEIGEFEDLFRELVEGKRDVYQGEKRYIRKDGSFFWGYRTVSAVRDENGNFRYAVSIVSDITERKRVEEAERAREQAEQANRAKSEFLSKMSHELRTPLNSILGFAQLLETDFSPNTPEGEAVARILDSGRHLLALIEEVLDLARIESGRLALSPEDIPIQLIIHEVFQLVSPMANSRRIRLQDYVSDQSYRVHVDRVRMRQVLLNLVSNAVKYNRDGGSVTLTGEVHGDFLRIRVTDTGPGIAHEHQKRLFEPFERLGVEETGIPGTGIGLVVAKQLIEAMGGALGFESTPGEGSCFWVDTPLVNGFVAEKKTDSGTGSRTILYIEDDPGNVQLVLRLLSRRPDLRLLTASHGRIGLELARSHHPDLILVDINLPGMDGFEVLRQLHKAESTRDIPVVALSARAMPADIERGLHEGFLRYLTKPLDIRQFMEVIEDILDSTEVS